MLGSQTWLRTKLGLTRVFLSLLDRPFGADQFYGNFNSWERTKTWLATLSQDLGNNTLFSLGYRRHTDLYELLRDDPGFYTNRHEDETWDVALRRHDAFRELLHVYYGAEFLADHVDSNNLGVHSRKRGALYGDLDVRSWHRLSFSAGTRQEFYGRAQTISVPSFSGGYWFSSKAKLRASVSRAFRLPNYTDLYYHDPANIGNPNLKPEKAMNYEAGVDLYPAARWRSSLTVFSRHETDDIDYTRANSSDIWQAMNFGRLTFTGWEASLFGSLPHSQTVQLEYTGLYGAHAALNGYQSKYVFNYPTQQAVIGWQRTSPRGLARAHSNRRYQPVSAQRVCVGGCLCWLDALPVSSVRAAHERNECRLSARLRRGDAGPRRSGRFRAMRYLPLQSSLERMLAGAATSSVARRGSRRRVDAPAFATSVRLRSPAS